MTCTHHRVVLLLIVATAAPLGCGPSGKALAEPARLSAKAHRPLAYHFGYTDTAAKGPEIAVTVKAISKDVIGTESSGTVSVSYPPGLRKRAQETAVIADQIVRHVRRETSLPLDPPVHIYLVHLNEWPRRFQAVITPPAGEEALLVPIPTVGLDLDAQKTILPIPMAMMLVHELVEASLLFRAPTVLGDVSVGGLPTVVHHTRWFRDGLATYAAWLAVQDLAEAVAGNVDPGTSPMDTMAVHPLSALSRVGPRLFLWTQSQKDDPELYDACFGLFLLIEHQYGRQAIRQIVHGIAELQHPDGPAIERLCRKVLGTDLRHMVATFHLPDTGIQTTSGVVGRVAVKSVVPNSLAAAAGIRPGDVLHECNAEPFCGSFGYEMALLKCRPEGLLVFAISRQGRLRHVIVRRPITEGGL
jgi:hypothetical protein